MKAEIISIGDELLIGQTINTNAAYLGEQLLLTGVRVERASVVADDLPAIVGAIESALARADVVITTGGLGPTHDDVTRAAVLQAFDSGLVFSPDVLGDVETFLARRGRSLLPVHRDQAMVPACAEVLRNPVGTAPGYHVRRDQRQLFVLPGVPEEMRTMFEGAVRPHLRESRNTDLAVRTFQTTGIPESSLAARIGAPESLPADIGLAYLPSSIGVRLRLTTRPDAGADSMDQMREAAAILQSRAGEYIFGEGTLTLAEMVGQLLRDRSLTVSVAESCTGGLLANMLTDVPGSSAYFDRGVVTYSDASKFQALEIDPAQVREHGAVSHQVARAMARRIRQLSGSAFGLSTTGIAGPGGATETKPVGLVWVGFSSSHGTFACKYLFGDDRLRNKQRASQAALDLLRRNILGLPRISPLVSELYTEE